MFKFRNKTVEQLRNEVVAYLGKEITLKNGTKWILESVSEIGERYIGTMTGVFEFQKNGEFDWNKGIKGIKMWGFDVMLSHTDRLGYKTSYPERILVPFEKKDDKQIVVTSRNDSILS
jgi:hypothetical protein